MRTARVKSHGRFRKGSTVSSLSDSQIVVEVDGSSTLDNTPFANLNKESLTQAAARLAVVMPQRLAVRISNECPMRCRMCGPRDSSRWAADWPELERTGRALYRRTAGQPAFGYLRLSEEAFARLCADQDALTQFTEIELRGGEPFVDPLSIEFLECAASIAPRATLSLDTSALSISDRGLKAACGFNRSLVRASAEATGPLFRYIRGRPFEEFEAGIAKLRSQSNFTVEIACAYSTYNAFGIAKLWTWAMAKGFSPIQFSTQLVERPPFLSAGVLPIETRARAASVLKESGMAESDFPSIYQLLQSDDRADDESRIRLYQEFIEFTSDLDRMRGERLAQAEPELVRVEIPASLGVKRGGLSWPSRR